MSMVNPMNMPEVVALVGRCLPLWKYSDRLGFYDFNPRFLISCTLVNKTWHNALTPVIWYVYNGSVMRSIPKEIIIKNSNHFRIFFYDRSFSGPFESRHLKDLVILWCDDKLVPLVETNAGSLRVLAWKGSASPSPMRVATLPMLDYDLFMRMASTLEKLQLSHWTLSGQDFVKFLTACKRLRSLSFAAIAWIDSAPFSSRPWSSLPLSSSSSSSPIVPRQGAFVDLVRSCPDLESFSLYSESSADARTLIPILREYCPHLTSIEYVARFSSALNGYDYLSDAEYSDLVLSARGLRSLKIDIPWLDDTMTKALILQSSNLMSLHLRFFRRRADPMTDAENICKILRHCIHLRKLSLFFSPHALGKDETLRLFEEPWACVGLETLELTDVTTTTMDNNTSTNNQHDPGLPGQPYHWRLASASRPIPIPIEIRSYDHSNSHGNGNQEGGGIRYGSLAKQKLFEQVRKLPKLAKLSLNHVTYSVDGGFRCPGVCS
ncbi:hypothetical protein BGZ65_010257 [Modicella reniformis]|uniref:F-box domain-containing protein n=1 Tax=Modicella reniformis TaxID=1440133 RepID=A0A9P6MLY3_9FUNG|nr:hypothetical protein BGZ65_010257 [Modicella reniformis]